MVKPELENQPRQTRLEMGGACEGGCVGGARLKGGAEPARACALAPRSRPSLSAPAITITSLTRHPLSPSLSNSPSTQLPLQRGRLHLVRSAAVDLPHRGGRPVRGRGAGRGPGGQRQGRPDLRHEDVPGHQGATPGRPDRVLAAGAGEAVEREGRGKEAGIAPRLSPPWPPR
jgi:hypothetical protein